MALKRAPLRSRQERIPNQEQIKQRFFTEIAYLKLENEIFDSTITITTPWFFEENHVGIDQI